VQVERLVIALERLCGAVEGMHVHAHCLVYDVVIPLLPALSNIQRIYMHLELVTGLLLTLASILASAHAGSLEQVPAEVCTPHYPDIITL
jgi:hypothetical protein